MEYWWEKGFIDASPEPLNSSPFFCFSQKEKLKLQKEYSRQIKEYNMRNITVVQRLPAKPPVSSVSRQKVRAGCLLRVFLQAPGQSWGFLITIPHFLAFIPKHKHLRDKTLLFGCQKRVWIPLGDFTSEVIRLPMETRGVPKSQIPNPNPKSCNKQAPKPIPGSGRALPAPGFL